MAGTETSRVPVAVLLERAQTALAFERERADAAEAMLANLANTAGQAVTAAVGAERARILGIVGRLKTVLVQPENGYRVDAIPFALLIGHLAEAKRAAIPRRRFTP